MWVELTAVSSEVLLVDSMAVESVEYLVVPKVVSKVASSVDEMVFH